MQTIDRMIQLVVSVFLIVGVYQFDFWCQRNPITQPREFRLAIDNHIPYRPPWVWIYSFLYLPDHRGTKQHCVVDLPAGAALGWCVFKVFKLIY